jgi:catechol 2,3-dioxygenase-like lactoylglutathione lyase family enzyme
MLRKGWAGSSAQEITMFSGGNVTVYVSDMDRAVGFYCETLGLKLAYRFGDHWASVEAGRGLTIGLHPASNQAPAGRKGSMAIGLELAGSLQDAIKRSRRKACGSRTMPTKAKPALSLGSRTRMETSCILLNSTGATYRRAKASIRERTLS